MRLNRCLGVVAVAVASCAHAPPPAAPVAPVESVAPRPARAPVVTPALAPSGTAPPADGLDVVQHEDRIEVVRLGAGAVYARLPMSRQTPSPRTVTFEGPPACAQTARLVETYVLREARREQDEIAVVFDQIEETLSDDPRCKGPASRHLRGVVLVVPPEGKGAPARHDLPGTFARPFRGPAGWRGLTSGSSYETNYDGVLDLASEPPSVTRFRDRAPKTAAWDVTEGEIRSLQVRDGALVIARWDAATLDPRPAVRAPTPGASDLGEGVRLASLGGGKLLVGFAVSAGARYGVVALDGTWVTPPYAVAGALQRTASGEFRAGSAAVDVMTGRPLP